MEEQETILLAASVVAVHFPVLLIVGLTITLGLIERPRRHRTATLWTAAGLLMIFAETLRVLGPLWMTHPLVRDEYGFSARTIGLVLQALAFFTSLLAATAWGLLVASCLWPQAATPATTASFWRHLRRLYLVAFVIGIFLSLLHLGARLAGSFALIAIAFALSSALATLFPVTFLVACRNVLSMAWGRLALVFLSLFVPIVNLVVLYRLDCDMRARIVAAGMGAGAGQR